MNDINFNNLKNLKVPEQCIENAVNIPNAQVPKPISFLKHSKAFISAACLVLVCIISTVAIVNKDKKDVLIISTDSDTVQTEESTKNPECTVQSEEKPTEQEKVKTNRQTNAENGGSPVEETQNSETSTQPPDKETQNPPSPSTVIPSQVQSTEPHTVPTEPSVIPTEDSTEKPTVLPQASKPDLAAIAEYKDVHDYCEVVDYIETKWLTGSKNVYCVVKNLDKHNSPWLGGDTLFTPDHLCTVWQEMNGYTYFAYSISNNYSIEEDGEYLYLIYNESGSAFFSNRVYVYANQ